jgi:hypothetical protein
MQTPRHCRRLYEEEEDGVNEEECEEETSVERQRKIRKKKTKPAKNARPQSDEEGEEEDDATKRVKIPKESDKILPKQPESKPPICDTAN